jgi:hypothetical protein
MVEVLSCAANKRRINGRFVIFERQDDHTQHTFPSFLSTGAAGAEGDCVKTRESFRELLYEEFGQ